MVLTKREFFKRKNRQKVYSVYATAVDHAYDLSDRYQSKVNILRTRKRAFQTGSHIWTLIDKAEQDLTSSFEQCAYLRCANLKRNNFIVSPIEYDALVLDIQKLSLAIGSISGLLDVVDYLERNELKVRAKK